MVAPLCNDCYYGNVQAHTLLDERNTTRTQEGCLLSGQRYTTPNTGGVFAVGTIKQTMDVTDVKRLGGTPLAMVGACSGPSGAPPVVSVALGRCTRTVPPQYGTRGRTPGPRGSYCSIPSQRWYLLGTVEARLHGEGLRAFSREVQCT